jgi:hypothetical protein
MMQNGIAYSRRSLATITYAKECLSQPTTPTPNACDGKGAGRSQKRLKRGPMNNLRDYFRQLWNLVYPPVAVVEYLMGFPLGWTDCEDSETL